MANKATAINSGQLARIDGLLGTDELNLCEFPLVAYGSRAAEDRTLTFEDDIYDEGNRQLVHRKLIVSASDAFGLPTPLDSDVLLVLMHLTRLRNNFATPTVHFTRYELVKFLGWDLGGKSYRRLEESLNRWASVTLYYNRAWWDKDGQVWRSRTFHILESTDLRGRESSNGDDCESSFTWNQVLFQSFASQNLRRLDLNSYFALKLPAARQAFRFLDKRFHRSRRLELKLRTFACEHVGLTRSYDNSQLRRKLQPAIEELEAIGFLHPLSEKERYVQLRRGEWEILLIKQGDQAKASKQELAPLSSLTAKLVGYGLHVSVAAELVAKHPAAKIEEKLKLYGWLKQQGGDRVPRNPAGFVTTAIRKDYPLPPELLREEVRRTQAVKKQPTVEKSAEDANNAAVGAIRRQALAYIDQLPPEDREQLQHAALSDKNNPLVQSYEKSPSGPMSGTLLREILIAYVGTERLDRTAA